MCHGILARIYECISKSVLDLFGEVYVIWVFTLYNLYPTPIYTETLNLTD